MATAARIPYRAFGHVVFANRKINGLPRWSARDRRGRGGPLGVIDVRLREWPAPLARPVRSSQQPTYVSPFRSPDGEPALKTYRRAGGALWHLDRPDGSRCAVDHAGARVWWTWPDTVADPEEFLLGTGLGFALRLGGELCLHAAAIDIDGRAVVLAGMPGSGKSTLAALLGRRPHAVVTDDLAVVRRRNGAFVVEPGPCRVRLRREVGLKLRRIVGPDLPLHPSPTGEFLDLPIGSEDWPQPRVCVPIDAIYLMRPPARRSPRAAVRDVSRADAVIALVADSWAARLQTPASRRREFDAVSALVAGVAVRQVVAGRGFASLLHVRDLLLADITRRRSAA
jgi:hypothetical protein